MEPTDNFDYRTLPLEFAVPDAQSRALPLKFITGSPDRDVADPPDRSGKNPEPHLACV